MTIGEAAQQLGVETHVLRYWETKFPQVSPVKRRGGRRFYRPEDMALLAQIKDLVHQRGYSIRGAQMAMEDISAAENRDALVLAITHLKRLRASIQAE